LTYPTALVRRLSGFGPKIKHSKGSPGKKERGREEKMGDRVTVRQFVEDVFSFNSNGDLPGKEEITKKGIRSFVQKHINETIPANEKENQTQDVVAVYRQYPKRSIQEINREASSTIGLEEQFRYFQEYCQKPRGKEIIETKRPEQFLICRYFEENWKNRFPLTSSSARSETRIPVELAKKQEGYEDDGDSLLVIMNGETHDVRFAESDTQESLKVNDLLIKMKKEDYKKYPPEGKLEGEYCYWSKTKKENHCVAKILIPNRKIRRQTGEVWDGLVRLAKKEEGTLAAAFKDHKNAAAIKEAFEKVGDIATRYRGKLGTFIREDITAYAEKKGIKWFIEPEYAIRPGHKNETAEERETRKKEGRFDGVDKYGRLIGWFVVSDPDFFEKYLLDDKDGLSHFASNGLYKFYIKQLNEVREELDKIDFDELGLTEEDEEKLRGLFIEVMVNPAELYAKEKMPLMAEEWKRASTGLKNYNYSDTLNFFLIYPLGLANHLDFFYPSVRGGSAQYLLKQAAKKGWGLFASKAYQKAYGPRTYTHK